MSIAERGFFVAVGFVAAFLLTGTASSPWAPRPAPLPRCGGENDITTLVIALTHVQGVMGNSMVALGFSSSVPSTAPAWREVLPPIATYAANTHALLRDLPKPKNPDLQPWWSILVAQDSVYAAAMQEWKKGMPRDLARQGPIRITDKQDLSQLLFEANRGFSAAATSLQSACVDGRDNVKQEDLLAEKYWAIGLDP